MQPEVLIVTVVDQALAGVDLRASDKDGAAGVEGPGKVEHRTKQQHGRDASNDQEDRPDQRGNRRVGHVAGFLGGAGVFGEHWPIVWDTICFLE